MTTNIDSLLGEEPIKWVQELPAGTPRGRSLKSKKHLDVSLA